MALLMKLDRFLSRKIRQDDKGFTLVELIIVIAIIAILSAVAAPQYVKYVERSRISSDMDTASAIESAVAVLCAEGTVVNADSDYVTWDVSTGLVGEGQAAVEEITGPIPPAISDKAKSTGDIVFSVNFNSSTPVVSTSVDYHAWDD